MGPLARALAAECRDAALDVESYGLAAYGEAAGVSDGEVGHPALPGRGGKPA